MPRKSMTGDKHSPVVRFRVNKEVQVILGEIKARDRNISEFIRESIKVNSIAKKFTLFFVNPKVTSHIPDNLKKDFLGSLTLKEKEVLNSMIGGSTQ